MKRNRIFISLRERRGYYWLSTKRVPVAPKMEPTASVALALLHYKWSIIAGWEGEIMGYCVDG